MRLFIKFKRSLSASNRKREMIDPDKVLNTYFSEGIFGTDIIIGNIILIPNIMYKNISQYLYARHMPNNYNINIIND